jgi:uncharacterized membrane protein
MPTGRPATRKPWPEIGGASGIVSGGLWTRCPPVSNRPKTNSLLAVHQESVSRQSGPLPAGVEFERYERVLPGTAERLVAMVEKEALHRQQLDNRVLDANIKFEGAGQILAFLAIFVAVVGAIACAALGQPLAVTVPALVALPSLLSTIFEFFNKRKK